MTFAVRQSCSLLLCDLARFANGAFASYMLNPVERRRSLNHQHSICERVVDSATPDRIGSELRNNPPLVAAGERRHTPPALHALKALAFSLPLLRSHAAPARAGAARGARRTIFKGTDQSGGSEHRQPRAHPARFYPLKCLLSQMSGIRRRTNQALLRPPVASVSPPLAAAFAGGAPTRVASTPTAPSGAMWSPG